MELVVVTVLFGLLGYFISYTHNTRKYLKRITRALIDSEFFNEDAMINGLNPTKYPRWANIRHNLSLVDYLKSTRYTHERTDLLAKALNSHFVWVDSQEGYILKPKPTKRTTSDNDEAPNRRTKSTY